MMQYVVRLLQPPRRPRQLYVKPELAVIVKATKAQVAPAPQPLPPDVIAYKGPPDVIAYKGHMVHFVGVPAPLQE